MSTLSTWLWLLLIYVIVFVIPIWRIVSKAGYAGAWSLLALVPLGNVIALWVFAFVRWPHEKAGA